MESNVRARVAPTITPEQASLIERFLTAYNAVDHELRRRMRLERETSFSQVVRKFVRTNPGWGGRQERLLAFGHLRNLLVHDRIRPFEPLAVPAREAVEEIEAFRQWFAQRVLPTFQCEVVSVYPSDSLASVLSIIAERDFSQFPVLDLEGRYCGLLTENGITRWLAHHTTREMTLVEFEEVRVSHVLGQEEQRPAALFMPRSKPLDSVLATFAQQEHLEAILITETGKKDEGLLGIATRWDLNKAVYGR